ncbi:polysaccharide deacetylase family protein [Clostridium weizhouense]|uniref:Polysaccharide deacetylase n=1 Tax=Clostridium weizhouense TaxID=2859781 RepID=A0ABS7AQ44_9CLOT|nr:polysaccharide deacetylase family protein [Clostridium weizhouense]MBW6410674.1 polysaccharide deacetylase [Clostridium weizhouense]
MKNRFKYFLMLVVNLLLIISIFRGNISNASVASNIATINELDSNNNINDYNEKVVYLTFDDGPSCKITDKILDILKENEVKATFFLIGSQIEDNEDVVKRIYNEGHSIGLHTYTHKFKKVYSSEDRFIQEMVDCRDEINKVIGISPNIIRFPGGSHKHLNDNFLRKLHDNKFKVYDWNIDNTDGLNPKLSTYKLYKRAIKGSDDLPNIILLMHCTDMQKNTCIALPEVIKYYKSQGYEFKTITEDTPEMYFKITKRTFNLF